MSIRVCKVNEWTNDVTCKHGTFRLNVIPKPQSVTTTSLPPLKSTAVSTMDLRPVLPPVYDQGSLGSCVSNATCALLSYQYSLLSKQPCMSLSRLFNYFTGRAVESVQDNNAEYLVTDSGLYVEDGLLAAKQYGLIPETLYPYNVNEFAYLPQQASWDAPRKYRNFSIQTVNNDMLSIQRALAQKQPVIFGMNIYESFYSTGSDGLIPDTSGNMVGGHCMLIVGYNTTLNRYIVRNSWSKSWGDHGYGYLLPNTLTQNAFDFYTVRYNSL